MQLNAAITYLEGESLKLLPHTTMALKMFLLSLLKFK